MTWTKCSSSAPPRNWRAPDAAQRGLRQWFAERLSGAENIKITDFSIPENSGMSNITLLFDLVWRDGKGPHQQSYVARLQPTEGKLVFPEYDLSVQYRAMAGCKSRCQCRPCSAWRRTQR